MLTVEALSVRKPKPTPLSVSEVLTPTRFLNADSSCKCSCCRSSSVRRLASLTKRRALISSNASVEWRAVPDGKQLYAILITGANVAMRQLHKRMPV